MRVVLCSAGSGEKSVVVVLSAFSVSWFWSVQLWMLCRYCCTWACACCGLLCVDSTVMSSAYVMVFTFAGGSGRSDMYMLKSVGERTPPCGTPVFVFLCVEVAPW